WSSSPLLEKTPQPRPSRILLQCQSTAPTVRRPTPNSRAVAVVDVGDTAVIDLHRRWKRATRWLRPALAGPQSGSQRPEITTRTVQTAETGLRQCPQLVRAQQSVIGSERYQPRRSCSLAGVCLGATTTVPSKTSGP